MDDVDQKEKKIEFTFGESCSKNQTSARPIRAKTFGLRLAEIENRHQTKSSLGPIDEAIDYCDPHEMSVYSLVPSTEFVFVCQQE